METEQRYFPDKLMTEVGYKCKMYKGVQIKDTPQMKPSGVKNHIESCKAL